MLVDLEGDGVTRTALAMKMTRIADSPVTIFTYSPGGDAIVAIGWSAKAGRFYRLLECC